ncbi:MAG TPA: DUF2799 domain-containing protein [Povalibacter sp.]
MRIFHSKSLLTVGILTVMAVVAGCSSMSADECLATDWRTVGYEDGVAGYSGNRVGQYRKACGKHGVTPDLAEYQLGREQGLLEFCRPQNGFRIGARGRGYDGICPAELDEPFLDAYQSGRQLYTLRSRVGNTADEIYSMQAESDRLDADLVSVAARILDPSITQEYRAQLLVDSKHMAERKGEIRARIPQLQGDLVVYQRELDDYRATLTYVE